MLRRKIIWKSFPKVHPTTFFGDMKPLRLITLMVLLVIGSLQTNAQQSISSPPPFSMGIGYWGGAITHPGILLFGELSLREGSNQLAIKFNLVRYRHRQHTLNHLILPELILRRVTVKNHVWEASLGGGMLIQQPDRPTYSRESGTWQEAQSIRLYIAPALGFRYGYRILLPNQRILTPSVGVKFFYQYPFNDFWLPGGSVDLSIAYQIR